MRTRKSRPRGAIQRLAASGILEAYRLDAAAVIALTLIGVTVHRLAPDLLWGYAGVVLLLTVWALGKAGAVKPPRPD